MFSPNRYDMICFTWRLLLYMFWGHSMLVDTSWTNFVLNQTMFVVWQELIKSKRLGEAETWQRKILHTLELSKAWQYVCIVCSTFFLVASICSMMLFWNMVNALNWCLSSSMFFRLIFLTFPLSLLLDTMTFPFFTFLM